jgi:hypothetical protein
MMDRPPRIYRSVPGLAWVKDAELTLIVQHEEGRSWALRGLEAAIWDLLTLSYSFPRLVDAVALLAGCEPGEAAEIVMALLHEWEEQGIVCAGEGTERG